MVDLSVYVETTVAMVGAIRNRGCGRVSNLLYLLITAIFIVVCKSILDNRLNYSYHLINLQFDKNIMAEHRPTTTLLALIEQEITQAPEGVPPRTLLESLQSKGEDISRPSLNRLLAQGVEKGLWSPVGDGRNITYILGSQISPLISDTSMPKTSSSKTTPANSISQNVQTQIRTVVWSIADTLRDTTQLQVEAYQPVTLALMALKRNMDIQKEALQEGGKFFQTLASEIPFLASNFRDPQEVAVNLNHEYRFWNPAVLKSEKFGLPFMTWEDFISFEDHDQNGEREPYTMVLRSNPPGHQTPETALWTYTTTAVDLKALMIEIIDSLVPDLKEAFGAIGIHNVLSSQSEQSATLSNTVLRKICGDQGDGKTKKFGLANFDLGLKNISVDVFSDTYMDLLGRFAEDSGKKGGEYFTPTPLVVNALKFSPVEEFAQTLSDNPNAILRLGDPTAGSNTFLIKAHEAITEHARRHQLRVPANKQFAFFAQELKSTQVGLGVFNMFYHGVADRLNPTETEIHVGRRPEQGGIVARINDNSITEYVNKIGQQANQLDWVLANPPYGTDDYGIVYANSARLSKEDQRWVAGVPTRSEGEWAFIQTIVDLLSPTGQATVVLPLGVLFRDGGQLLRQWLIEKDWIEAVISTPSNQFLTTSIPVCLLILNKNKKSNKGGVYFINASNDFTKQGKFNEWNVEKSLQAWKGKQEIPNYSGFVSAEKLQKNKYSLAVNRYFAPPKEKVEYNPHVLNQELQSLQQSNAVRSQWLFGEDGLSGVFGQAQAAWDQAQTLQNAENQGDSQ